MKITYLVALFAILYTHSLMGQANILDVSMQMSKKEYMSNEHIRAVITLTNNGANDIALQNERGINWIEFVITKNGGKDVNMLRDVGAGSVIVPAGKTIKKTYALTMFYALTKPGNYTIRARVNPPGNQFHKKISEPRFFDVIQGVELFRRQVGVKAANGRVMEYRILVLNLTKGDQLYFQSYDVADKKIISTYSLGPYTRISKPLFEFDNHGFLNTIFQVQKDKFRFLTFAPNGKILKQEIIKSTPAGRPFLAKDPKTGGLVARNATIYNVEEERKKQLSVHDISQRPPFAY